MTKDYLQQKRFQAQSNGTTYVYDYPDMFRQVLVNMWHERREMLELDSKLKLCQLFDEE